MKSFCTVAFCMAFFLAEMPGSNRGFAGSRRVNQEACQSRRAPSVTTCSDLVTPWCHPADPPLSPHGSTFGEPFTRRRMGDQGAEDGKLDGTAAPLSPADGSGVTRTGRRQPGIIAPAAATRVHAARAS
jgi:hypothetical protein